MNISGFFQISSEHITKVIDEITYGSQPAFRFYMLVVISTLIASIGLVANSTAVIIGAMLVAPLMMPIFGISLALVLGDMRLLFRAIKAEAVGIILAIGIASIFGFLPLAFELTPEMLSRTQPNLLDLMVAVAAGTAGSYAMVNERLSPALPGVAIATAIVPPLANTGLCISVGAYHGALGSFLLFFANFLSILLISSTIFIASGLSQRYQWTTPKAFIKRFGLAVVCFVGMGIFLTYSLVGIVTARYLDLNIDKVLREELSRMYGTSFESEIHEFSNNKLYIFATARTPRIIPPPKVNSIQQKLSNTLKYPTELIIQSVVAQNINATGLTDEVGPKGLEGHFLSKETDPDDLKITVATQVLWERLSALQNIKLINLELVKLPRGPTVVATLVGSVLSRFSETEIGELEDEMQKRLNDERVSLVIQSPKTEYFDRWGRLLPEWSHYGDITPDKEQAITDLETAVKREIKRVPGLFTVDIYLDAEEDPWNVLVEAVGTRMITTSEIEKIEKAISRHLSHQINLSVWFRQEAIVTRKGYSSIVDETEEKLIERRSAAHDLHSD